MEIINYETLNKITQRLAGELIAKEDTTRFCNFFYEYLENNRGLKIPETVDLRENILWFGNHTSLKYFVDKLFSNEIILPEYITRNIVKLFRFKIVIRKRNKIPGKVAHLTFKHGKGYLFPEHKRLIDSIFEELGL